MVHDLLYFKSIFKCLKLNLAKRLHLSHRVFWKAGRHLTGKNLSTFVPQGNFFVVPKRLKSEKQVFMQESGDHVSYRVPRSIYRPIHRSIYRTWLDRHPTDMSIDCRPRVDRCFRGDSTDVGRGIDRDRIGSLSVNYRRNIGELSAECRSCIIR